MEILVLSPKMDALNSHLHNIDEFKNLFQVSKSSQDTGGHGNYLGSEGFLL